MKIENKNFWEKHEIIETQEVLKSISNFEQFMFENSLKRYEKNGQIENIKIFGCGTGREIEGIAKFFKPKKIVASDISKNMIIKCNENLKLWNIDDITSTLVVNAKDYNVAMSEFELVTILNSMLTYVPDRSDRIEIFKNSHTILKKDGILIGTVHNQVGTLAKTIYFKLRGLFYLILREKVGNRDTGFKGFKVKGFYYNKKGLLKDLQESGFCNIEVYSIEDFYSFSGRKYDRRKGYNNLFFIASK